MRRLLLLIVLAAPANAEGLKDLVEKQAEALTKDRPYAAVVVGVLHEDKEHVFAFGKHDSKIPDRDSEYEIGSITKVFTGILLADRVKQGVVKLDDPVQKFLPAGWTMPRRDDRDISFLHLATHTSGLTRQPDGFLAVVLKYPKEPFAKYDVDAMKKGLPKTNIPWAIGSKYEYSNLGVGLIGHALAQASKTKNHEELLTARVLEPLSLADTRITLTGDQKKRIIPGFNAKGEAQPNWDFACMESCGAMSSTVGDMLKFLRANIKPDGSLKDALEMSHQSWRELSPTSECGLCWVRNVKKNSPVTIWHNGQTAGYHSFAGFVPGKGGVVVLCNVAIGKVDDVGFRVLKFIAEDK